MLICNNSNELFCVRTGGACCQPGNGPAWFRDRGGHELRKPPASVSLCCDPRKPQPQGHPYPFASTPSSYPVAIRGMSVPVKTISGLSSICDSTSSEHHTGHSINFPSIGNSTFGQLPCIRSLYGGSMSPGGPPGGAP